MRIDSYNWYKKIKKRYLITGVILAAVLVVLAFGAYFQMSKTLLKPRSEAAVSDNNPQEGNETSRLAAQVSTLMDLPVGEIPILASVTDSEKVKSTPFLAQAENGDKILVYKSIKKAILFRPSTGKIIEVAPVTDTAEEASSSAQLLIPAPVNVVIKNGTTVKGLALQNKAQVEAVKEGIKVIKTENAAKTDYKETLIIPNGSDFKQLAQLIAEKLKGTVVETLPEGEKFTADINIVVILGGK